MEFYNRTNEIEIIKRNLIQSKKSSCFTVLIGRRRIGKTSLLFESLKGEKYLYLFVSRKSETLLCAEFQQEACEMLGMSIFGNITKFKELFEQLLLFAISRLNIFCKYPAEI